MVSDLDGSFVPRYFRSDANERTCFASLACQFKISELISGLNSSSDLKDQETMIFLLKRYICFLSRVNEINGGCENSLPV